MRCCEWYRESKREKEVVGKRETSCRASWGRPCGCAAQSQQMWAVTQTSPAPHLLSSSLPYPLEDCPTTLQQPHIAHFLSTTAPPHSTLLVFSFSAEEEG